MRFEDHQQATHVCCQIELTNQEIVNDMPTMSAASSSDVTSRLSVTAAPPATRYLRPARRWRRASDW